MVHAFAKLQNVAQNTADYRKGCRQPAQQHTCTLLHVRLLAHIQLAQPVQRQPRWRP